MQIQENILLAPYTTFKIGGPAKYFCVTKDFKDLQEALEFSKNKKLRIYILGGGSNVLINDNGFDGLVVKIEFLGVQILSENDQELILQVASGEPWDKIVEMAVKNNWWGIENLSHIPGKTGAVVVQNVGAYSQEAGQVAESVEVFDLIDGKIKVLKNQDCKFSYRRSIFNSTEKGRYVILSIRMKLNKNGRPNLAYRDLKARFKEQNPSLIEIRKAITEIRDKKYPFPQEAKNGNAGSFFKNLIIDANQYQSILTNIEKSFGKEAAEKFKARKFEENGKIKLPAAYLMDICGLKDLRVGGAAINHNQPLVIINKAGNATAQDVLDLANLARSKVKEKTGIELQFEPEMVGF